MVYTMNLQTHSNKARKKRRPTEENDNTLRNDHDSESRFSVHCRNKAESIREPSSEETTTAVTGNWIQILTASASAGHLECGIIILG
ncbi:hypothetical protein J6590_027623 [Homalodisca vitripennis]|nr:hypothetical protein J6590_027623 [Homalodisca vitripennis]